MRLFRRHTCPPDIQLTVRINGETIIGPIMGEELAYITKYGGNYPEPLELIGGLNPTGQIHSLEIFTHFPGKRR